jgi:hypothetical protein
MQGLDINSIFARMVEIIKVYWLPLLLLSVILVMIPQAIMLEAIASSSFGLASFVVPFIVGVVTQSLLTSVMIVGVLRHLAGAPPLAFGELMTRGFKTLLSVILVSLIAGVAIGIGMLLLLVPGFFLLVLWYVVVPVTVVEQADIGTAFSRSGALTSGYRWTLLGVAILLFIVGMVVGFVAAIFGPFGQAIAGGLMAMIGCTLVSLIYHDLRRIKDGQSSEEIAAGLL